MHKKISILIVLVIGVVIFVQAQTWDPVKRLTHTPGSSAHPAVAILPGIWSNNMHLVWSESVGNYEIFHKKSTDGGSSWSENKRLTWNSGVSDWPVIAIDSKNNIHIVWQDNTPGNYEIYYKKSTDGGTTWTAMKRLTWNLNLATYPDILVRTSTLSNGAKLDNIHIVWSAVVGTDFEIFHKYSSNGGSTWASPHIKRLTWNLGMSMFPKIAIDSGNRLHLVWQDNTTGNYEIYYKMSEDGGNAWTTERLTWNTGWSSHPAIAIDPAGNINLVWEDDVKGNSEIYYKTHDGITIWSASERLTWSSQDSHAPFIIAFKTFKPMFVWYGDSSGNDEIYHKLSNNGGSTWSSKRLSWSPGASFFPVMAMDYTTESIHVFWSDDSPGNSEIYYRKGK